jgi:ParB-like chromosome segregation protein Spo0J
MKWQGYRQIKLSSLHLDVPDIRRRSKAAHVVELAGDIAAAGEEPIHAPTIRGKDKRLLCGRDRVAALITLKSKRAWVHVVDCTDTEAKQLELRENIYRRPVANRSEMIAELVSLKEQQIQAHREEEGVTVSPAPQHSAKAEARREVARAAGMTPASVKRAEMRANAKEADPFAPAAAGEVAPAFVPNLKLLGVPIEHVRQLCELAAPRQAAIDEADKHLRLAQAALKRAEHDTQMQQLYADVHRVASRVRSCRPEMICPWCKGVPALVATCSGCQMAGYVSEEQGRNCPPELLGDADPVVVVNGQLVPYADASAGKLGAMPHKPKFGPGRCEFCGGPNGKAGTGRCARPGCQPFKATA